MDLTPSIDCLLRIQPGGGDFVFIFLDFSPGSFGLWGVRSGPKEDMDKVVEMLAYYDPTQLNAEIAALEASEAPEEEAAE